MSRQQPRRQPAREPASAARVAAMSTIRAAIERAAVECFDGTAGPGPSEGAGVSGPVFDPDYSGGLAGVGAARLALEVAGKLLRDYALDARAGGCSWDDVAAALELPENDHRAEIGDGPGAPRGETAFEWLIGGQPPPREAREPWWQRSMASWRCGTCRNRVIDRGPFESHPDDCEYGHGADCSRRTAALEQWARELDDDGHEHTNEQDDHEQDHENERDEQGEDGGADGGGGQR